MSKTNQNYELYNSKRWRKLSHEIRRRDNHLCQLCIRYGRQQEATQVHHIVEVEEDWDKRFDKDNLISLCHSCHNKVRSNTFIWSG